MTYIYIKSIRFASRTSILPPTFALGGQRYFLLYKYEKIWWRRWESNPYPIPFTLALSTVETIPSPYMQLIFDQVVAKPIHYRSSTQIYRPHQPITIGFLKRFFSAFLRIPIFPKFSAVVGTVVSVYTALGLQGSRNEKI